MDAQLLEEVRRIVAEAIESGEVLQVGPAAKRIASAHADADISETAIADLLMHAGVRAAVPLEIEFP
ncbi:hypothetical protein [Propylenella binzhouense]|uniref:Uncharacterized protein n=1 Tax=Propylenella binzhouense TaxID=2555902 RepID=A0A964T7M8_9HYPH|nr:hypothetical protein [Propylenella binzhouense]MYZ49950.1 hypothetical protein [Propylenella binzhouense]